MASITPLKRPRNYSPEKLQALDAQHKALEALYSKMIAAGQYSALPTISEQQKAIRNKIYRLMGMKVRAAA